MTDMEKKVMVRLCAKILTETDLYDTDKEVQNLIDWVLVSEQMKENNNVDGSKVKMNDEVTYKGVRYKVVDPANLGMQSVCIDISLEVVQNG